MNLAIGTQAIAQLSEPVQSESTRSAKPIVLAQADLEDEDDLFGDDDDLFGDDDDLFGDDPGLIETPEPVRAPTTPGSTAPGGESGAPDGDGDDDTGYTPLPPGAPGVEELLIQGSVRQRRESDVTDSVKQFNADALKDLGAADVADLADVTPNLEIKTAGVGAPTFFIRGIGLSDFSGNAASAVSIVQDGSIMDAPAVQIGLLYDIGNVEVINGPQPTGLYRNSSAGALIISAAPPTPDVGGNFRASAGNYSAQDYEGFLNLPLIDDRLFSRFSFRYQDRDGFYNNVCAGAGPLSLRNPNTPATNRITPGVLKNTCGEDDPSVVPADLKSEPFDTHVWGGRAQLKFQPDVPQFDNIDFTLGFSGEFRNQGNQVPATVPAGGNPTVTNPDPTSIFPLSGFLGTGNYLPVEINREYNRLRDYVRATLVPQGTPMREARTNDIVIPILNETLGKRGDQRPYSIANNREATIKQNSWTGFLRSNVEFGDISFGGVDFGTLTYKNTSSFNEYWRRRTADNDGTPNVNFESNEGDKAWQVWHNSDFTGEANPAVLPGPVKWNLGMYYLQTQLRVDRTNFINDANGPRSKTDYTQDILSFGLYGDLQFTLGDFILAGGARYNYEQKTFDTLRTLFQTGGDLLVQERRRTIFTRPTGNIRLIYNLRDDISMFWKYTRGHKAGHFNATSDPIRGITDAAPEQIDAWETGFSGIWFDGKVKLSANFFFYEYKDFQLFIVEESFDSSPQLEVQNAEQVENYGAEVSLSLQPIENFDINVNFGWLESKFIRFTDEVLRQFPVGENFSEFETFTVVTDFSGNRLPNSPQFSVSLSAQYELDMGNLGFLIPRYDLNWVDDTYFDREEGRGGPNAFGQRNLPDFALGQKDRTIHGIRLAYRTPDRKIEIAGWGRNITNEITRVTGFDATALGVGTINFLGEPRMFGGEVVYTW